MIPGRGKPLSLDITSSSREKFAPLMIFDCRGFEPVDFFFGSGWEAVSVSICILVNFSLSVGCVFKLYSFLPCTLYYKFTISQSVMNIVVEYFFVCIDMEQFSFSLSISSNFMISF